MAEKRYKIIHDDESQVWMYGCPAQIDKYQLLLDTITGNALLRVKFFNLSDVGIKSIYLKTVCYDDTGDILSEMNDIAIQRVNANPHTGFGKDNLVVLNNNKATRVNIIIEKIALANATVWRNDGITPLSIPSLIPITAHENSKQIAREFKDAKLTGQYIYTEFVDKWACTCGQINEKTKERCGRCLIGRKWQISHFNKEYLSVKTAEYEAKCKRIAEKKKKEQIYLSAQNTQENGTEKAYRDAAEFFMSIQDYEDSSAMAKKSLEKADALYIEEEKKKKIERKFKRVLLISTIILIVVALIELTFLYLIISSMKHNNALNNYGDKLGEKCGIVFYDKSKAISGYLNATNIGWIVAVMPSTKLIYSEPILCQSGDVVHIISQGTQIACITSSQTNDVTTAVARAISNDGDMAKEYTYTVERDNEYVWTCTREAVFFAWIESGGLFEDIYEELDNKVDKVAVSVFDKSRFIDFGSCCQIGYYRAIGDEYTLFDRNTDCDDIFNSIDSMVENEPYVNKVDIGTASDGQHIYAYKFTSPIQNSVFNNKTKPKILLVSGQHGYEKSAVFGIYYMIRDMLENWDEDEALAYLRNHVDIIWIPILNTYGFDHNSYKNANGVNINRNFDYDWSEIVADPDSDNYGSTTPFDQPETIAIRDFILSNRDILFLIDYHTPGSIYAPWASLNSIILYQTNDKYYNRLKDVARCFSAELSERYKKEFNIGNAPNGVFGSIGTGSGNGLPSWACLQGIMSITLEGLNGFEGGTDFDEKSQKASTESIVNLVSMIINQYRYNQ